MKQLSEKLYSWASILEPQTRLQAEATARMPFIYPHLALMPDAHLGKGATVGSVIPTIGAIMPAAVGVDIGCGMMTVRTQYTEDNVRRNTVPLHKLRELIEKVVPSSAGNYNTEIYNDRTRDRISQLEKMPGILQAQEVAGTQTVTHIAGNQKGWDYQLGTLGGGNHFIEVSADETGAVWLFLHSGSRGVGNRLAQKHIKVAQGLMKTFHVKLENPDLAYIPEDVPQFNEYIEALRWAQMFAKLNREEMMDRVQGQFGVWIGEAVAPTAVVQCHHNYTVRESHFGKDVWLSRKGAIDAHEGVMGLIPGSMGAASYVVEGKGDKMSLNSAPHGAGRMYGRNAAKKEFTYEQLAESMKGIEWSGSKEFLDEIPQAYKPIDVVMNDAADLVEIKHQLHQIVNVKGN